MLEVLLLCSVDHDQRLHHLCPSGRSPKTGHRSRRVVREQHGHTEGLCLQVRPLHIRVSVLSTQVSDLAGYIDPSQRRGTPHVGVQDGDEQRS